MKRLLIAASVLSLIGGAAAQAQPRDHRGDRRDFRRGERFERHDRREAERDRYWYGGRWNNRWRGPAYAFPRGYGYHRWYSGQILPRVFLAPSYYLNWGAYRLPPPAPGFHYVRVGADILLVGPSGYIREVIPGFFY
jgi:Ni/Co efflux regulator RcnB